MKYSFLLFILLQSTLCVTAQKRVLNPKFNIMLDTLLTHTVKEVLPNDINNSDLVLFLDSRAKKEFKVSHIKNAKWVGFSGFNLKRVKEIPKDKNIVVYCTVGYRSEKIAEKLIAAGFTNVSNLYGGIFEWMHRNKTIVNDKGETKKVHTYNKDWAKWLDRGIKMF